MARTPACLFLAALLLSAALPAPQAQPTVNPNTIPGIPLLLQLVGDDLLAPSAALGVLDTIVPGASAAGGELLAILRGIAAGNVPADLGLSNVVSQLLPLLPVDSTAFGQLTSLVPADLVGELIAGLSSGSPDAALGVLTELLAANGITTDAALVLLEGAFPGAADAASSLAAVFAGLADGSISPADGITSIAGLLAPGAEDALSGLASGAAGALPSDVLPTIQAAVRNPASIPSVVPTVVGLVNQGANTLGAAGVLPMEVVAAAQQVRGNVQRVQQQAAPLVNGIVQGFRG